MLQAKVAANQLLVIVQLHSFILDRAPTFYLRWFSLVKKVVGKSHAFSHKIDSCLRRIILLLNEDDEARDVPGNMATSNGIRKKLFLQWKVFYWHRWQCKHTFHRVSLSEQVNEEQQSLLKQNENREKQDLPKATPELYQYAETPSKRNEVEQNNVAPGQAIVQEVDAEVTLEANWRVTIPLPLMRLSISQT